ncbi:MAG: hypothetical protein H7343_09075 [Undibacterium sp.]|nr:hypothetical protein [Opitutaceae bacterium]
MVFLGTEATMLAPWAFDVAFLVDLFGAGFFKIFVLGHVILTYSQAVIFVKNIWHRFVAMTCLKSPRNRFQMPKNVDAFFYSFYEAGERIRHILVQSATLGSCVFAVALLIRQLAKLNPSSAVGAGSENSFRGERFFPRSCLRGKLIFWSDVVPDAPL